MHELPATQGMLSLALDAARDAGAERVLAIDVVVGELASIVDDSVQFYFDVLSRGTAAEGATLRFRREPGVADCLHCGASHAVKPPLDPLCPACECPSLRVTGGREFYIESIEVEDEGPDRNRGPEGQ